MTVPPQPNPSQPDLQSPPSYGASGYPPPLPPASTPSPPAEVHPSGLDEKGHVRRTKVSAVWVGLIVAAIVAIALLIFIAQNSASVSIHYLGARGRVPLAVALLLSAVAGLVIAAIPGTVRILQLRRSVKQNAPRH